MNPNEIAHTFQNGGRSEEECLNMAIEYLKKQKRFIKIRAIEQELRMPDSTLIKAVNGTQKLSKKWISPLVCFLNDLIKS